MTDRWVAYSAGQVVTLMVEVPLEQPRRQLWEVLSSIDLSAITMAMRITGGEYEQTVAYWMLICIVEPRTRHGTFYGLLMDEIDHLESDLRQAGLVIRRYSKFGNELLDAEGLADYARRIVCSGEPAENQGQQELEERADDGGRGD
ncbi:MAG TPA: hypothetical protein VLF21_01920 [Candidatus Saccharimonadales bacterium]|nr:hypothetical protein [Candidatus Saccharimonadales bacterium]